jgi:hypothetical protein
VTRQATDGDRKRPLLSLVGAERLTRVLRTMLDEREFLSPHGIRALSRDHAEQPYVLHVDGREHRVDYEPAESTSGLFGGNSNWRGPIWFAMNFLIVEALQRFDHFYRGEVKVEFPTGSGHAIRSGKWPPSCRAGSRASPCATSTDGARFTAAWSALPRTHTGVISCSSMNTFTATMGPASAPAPGRSATFYANALGSEIRGRGERNARSRRMMMQTV